MWIAELPLVSDAGVLKTIATFTELFSPALIVNVCLIVCPVVATVLRSRTSPGYTASSRVCGRRKSSVSVPRPKNRMNARLATRMVPSLDTDARGTGACSKTSAPIFAAMLAALRTRTLLSLDLRRLDIPCMSQKACNS